MCYVFNVPKQILGCSYSSIFTRKTRILENRGQSNIMNFQDLASAAGIAAEKALAAAEAAAHLASYQSANEATPVNFNPASHNSTSKSMPNNLPNSGYEYYSGYESVDQRGVKHEQTIINDGRKMFRRQSYNCQRAHTDTKFDESDYDEEMEMEEPPRSTDARKINRRHSYNVPPQQSDIRYDESDDDDIEEVAQPMSGTNKPPERPAPQAPVRRVHPKLPDYDVLAARFEALKHHKGQPK